jgi:hypothetical protein
MINEKKWKKLIVYEKTKCEKFYKSFNNMNDLEKENFFKQKQFKRQFCQIVCDNIYELCKHSILNHNQFIDKTKEFAINLTQSLVNKKVFKINNNLLNKMSDKTNGKKLKTEHNLSESELNLIKIKCIWKGCGVEVEEHEYNEHINNHLLFPFRCECGLTFGTEIQLTRHKHNEHNHRIDINSIADKILVINGMEINVNDNDLDLDVSIDYKLSDIFKAGVGFKCNFHDCNQIFEDIKDFEIHRIIHSNVSFIKTDLFVKTSTIDRAVEHYCRIKNCKHKSKSRNAVINHISSHFGFNPFRCEHKNCFERFNDRVKCREHEIWHFYKKDETMGEFVCFWPNCMTRSVVLYEMMCHVNRHIEVLINCDICGKQFLRSSHLAAHQMIHYLNKESTNKVEIDRSYHFKQESNKSYTCLWPNCGAKCMSLGQQMLDHIEEHYGIIKAIEKPSKDAKSQSSDSTLSSSKPILKECSFTLSKDVSILSSNVDKSISEIRPKTPSLLKECSVTLSKDSPILSSNFDKSVMELKPKTRSFVSSALFKPKSNSNKTSFISSTNASTSGLISKPAQSLNNSTEEEKDLIKSYKLKKLEIRLPNIKDILSTNQVSNIRIPIDSKPKLTDNSKEDQLSKQYGLKKCELKLHLNNKIKDKYGLNLSIYD